MTGPRLTSTQMLEKLVGFDTTSHKSNLDFMDFVRNYLQDHGVESDLIYNEAGTKANLHACIGPADVPGTILSGHSDVVPIEGQNWASDPFILHEKDEKLYGRGTSDMKGFIAVALASLPNICAADLKKPFHFAFSYDEETGCTGVIPLLEFLSGHLAVKPELCIVGEPTSMRPINAHKGDHNVFCEITGHECHSSLAPYGVNAVEYGAELISYIKKMTRRIAAEGPFNTDFDPPFSTLHVGVFNGGTALNIVPNHASIEIEIRSIPEQDSDQIVNEIREHAFRILEPHMKDIDPKTGFKFTDTVKVPAFSIDQNSDAVQLVQNLTGENQSRKVSFATEAGHFQSHGIPTVVCGPGNIEQAHRPDEFIEKEQLVKCERFLKELIKHAI